MKRYFLAIAIVFISAGCVRAETYTYVDLVNKLIDLEGLSALPASGEYTAQWSSYDRASKYDAVKDRYIDWDANGDGGGIIRKEGNLSVMAEMEGPGVIWRIWSAAAGGGHVKIYIDGAAEPVVDLPFSGYFDLKNPPFVYPNLVHNASSGLNSFVPIPYQKSCKIVAEDGWGNYYHFTYETFPKGTVLPTFSRDMPDTDKAALKRVDDFLENNLGADPACERSGESVKTVKITPAAGKKVPVLKLKGPQAITGIRVMMDPGAITDARKLLRSLALSIRWDGETEPSVWTPLGDFFGTAYGIHKYKSLPLGMTDTFFYSRWYMPFASEAVIELQNDGKTDAPPMEFEITRAPLTRPIEKLGRFHAKWHTDAFLPKEKERAIDWTLLKTKGSGRYVGVMLHVMNPNGGWWGEGDEKFFVDGEKFPSTFGTGSEDYFGYAWCNPTLFHNAFHNQTYNQRMNMGHVSVNRWQIADNVPFHTEFEGDIEKYFSNLYPTHYAATVYWYLSPDGQDAYKPAPLKERLKNFDMKLNLYKAPAGAMEGENLDVREVTGGKTETQNMDGFGNKWGGGAQLWWTGAKPGDALFLALPVEKAGKYQFSMQLTKAKDYGIVQFAIDGEKLGGPVDLYNPDVIPYAVTLPGTVTLDAGAHALYVRMNGANPAAVPAYMVGIDYVLLKAVK